jgi:DNA-directed RNA polymerase subunit omega
LKVARITIEDCLKKVPSRFELVHLAAQRVRQIREGSEYLVSSPKNEDIVVSLREIAAGKITKENVETPQDIFFNDMMAPSATDDKTDDTPEDALSAETADDMPDGSEAEKPADEADETSPDETDEADE